MRGVVTLAAAAGIPLTLHDGSPFPGRPEIQAIAFLVAVGTLLLQGATLPWLIRAWASRTRAEADLSASSAARWSSSRTGVGGVFRKFVADPPPGIDPAFVERASERFERQREAASEAALDARERGAAGERDEDAEPGRDRRAAPGDRSRGWSATSWTTTRRASSWSSSTSRRPRWCRASATGCRRWWCSVRGAGGGVGLVGYRQGEASRLAWPALGVVRGAAGLGAGGAGAGMAGPGGGG